MNHTDKDITWHQPSVSRTEREERHGHVGTILWFTGLSGAGKSTIANAVECELFRLGAHTVVLDGDNVRHGLCTDLGFSMEDRTENIRRVGEVAKIFVDAGMIVLSAFISPIGSDRDRIRHSLSGDDFIEIYCACPISICETRDVKGLYRKARAGIVNNLTGISSPYEIPDAPELILDTSHVSVNECVDKVLYYLQQRGIFCAA
jgi:adenylylsulfate kinase